MKKLMTTLICSALVAGFWGCDKSEEADTEPPNAEAPAQKEEPKQDEAPEQKEDDTAAETGDALARVEVSEAGSKFDPPVKAEQLPEGAWYCDMGTVHWAGMNKPEDGKCPECGMALKQYQSADQEAQKAKAIEPHDDDGHGHEHGDGDEHGHEH